MIDRISIIPIAGPLNATVRPPGSKSITNRALVCAALAKGTSVLTGALDSQDTRVMIDSLQKLGIQVEHDPAKHELRVAGCGGKIPATKADLFVGNSGTTVRFLTGLVALGHGEYRLDGIERMRARPIADLLEGLKQLGVDAKSEANNGFPPVVVKANGLRSGISSVRGDVSSQFLSGLLLAAPLADGPIELRVQGGLVSKPYIQITLEVMRAFGVDVPTGDLSRFVIPAPLPYGGRNYDIEPDASAASYFFAAAAITGGRVTVNGLSKHALQGDVAFVECLEKMGCTVESAVDSITVSREANRPLRGVTVDMNAISDTAQTLAAVALFADGPTTITNIAHVRHKETDRIGDLATELRKFGATVETRDDGLTIAPAKLHGAEIETYNDHRMAMSLALVGLKVSGVTILNPRCVEKTYPEFFRDLEALRRG